MSFIFSGAQNSNTNRPHGALIGVRGVSRTSAVAAYTSGFMCAGEFLITNDTSKVAIAVATHNRRHVEREEYMKSLMKVYEPHVAYELFHRVYGKRTMFVELE